MWLPKTERELIDAAKTGVLTENATGLELKRELAENASANKELARDLASLAINGGALIIGVVDVSERDPGDPSTALNPVPLPGLPERVEQVALSRCDPPLFVRCISIPSQADPDVGYLTVQVPPSTVAPHMVDGRYWGRGDQTKRPLNDMEVVALHERRRIQDLDASGTLDAYVARDPFVEAGIEPELAHLFVVAIPRPGRSRMLLESGSGGPGWRRGLMSLIQKRANDEPRFGSKWAPDFHYATNLSTRGDGWAASSHGLSAGRHLDEGEREDNVLEIELTEDGGCRLFCSRASDVLEPGKPTVSQVLFDELIAGLVYRVVQLAGDIAEVSNYHGAWALGVAVTGARGRVAWLLAKNFMATAIPYSDDEYRSLIRASSQELQDEPGLVTDRLVGRMLRTLGTHGAPELDRYLGRRTDH